MNSIFSIQSYLGIWTNKKHIVIYLEELGDWGFLKGVFLSLRSRNLSNLVILKSFNETVQDEVQEYYVGKGSARVFLFRVMPASLMVTTMTDIDNLNLKKSIGGTKYVYVFHSLASINAVYLEGAFDNYDYIFACHESHVRELTQRRALCNATFQIKRGGYPRLDKILTDLVTASDYPTKVNSRKKLLIAPTWGDSALSPVQIKQICDYLKDDYDLTLRLHPMVTTRRKGRAYVRNVSKLEIDGVTIKKDVSTIKDFIESDLLITDWSGAAFEFSYGTGRPTISVDTPQKIRNSNFNYEYETLESKVRREIGVVIDPRTLNDIKRVVGALLDPVSLESLARKIENSRSQVFNLGSSSGIIASDILDIFEEI